MFNKRSGTAGAADQSLLTLAAHAELLHSEAEVLANDPGRSSN
jgi:hypothetical protein